MSRRQSGAVDALLERLRRRRRRPILVVNDERGARDPPTSVADRDYFKEHAARPAADDRAGGTSRVSGEPIVVLTMPVFTGDGRVAAVLGGSLRLSSRSLLDDLTQATPDRARRSRPSSSMRRPDPRPTRRAPGCCARAPRAGHRGGDPRMASARPPDRARRLPLRSGEFEVGVAGVPDADWLVFRTAAPTRCSSVSLQGEKRARGSPSAGRWSAAP